MNSPAVARVSALFAGFAVDSIIRGDARSTLFYAVIVLAFWAVGVARRAVDTRTFTRIYADLAVPVILTKYVDGCGTRGASPGVCRFLRKKRADYGHRFDIRSRRRGHAAGNRAMIGVASLGALLLCMALLPRFARRNQSLHQRLNDRLEKEIGLVAKVGTVTLKRHYRVLSRLRIHLSNLEAGAFLFVGSVAAVLFVIAISRLALAPAVKAGHVYAVTTYLRTFVNSLDEAP